MQQRNARTRIKRPVVAPSGRSSRKASASDACRFGYDRWMIMMMKMFGYVNAFKFNSICINEYINYYLLTL